MSYESSLKRFLLKREVEVPENSTIELREEIRFEGFCSTCTYEEQVVVFYVNGVNVYETFVDFGSLVRELTS